ncbi:MAG: hypothetical protein LC749_20595 [Actinobacteria bacterium]|nr:hypothetical protein [Actinomycetota bacterium]
MGLDPVCCGVAAVCQQPSESMAVPLLLAVKLSVIDGFEALLECRELAAGVFLLEHGIDKLLGGQGTSGAPASNEAPGGTPFAPHSPPNTRGDAALATISPAGR